MAIIIGLDLSLTATGLVIIKAYPNVHTDPILYNETIEDQILIESSAKEETTPRIIKINDRITKIIVKHKPNLVVMEGPAFGVQKSSSIFTLGELAGLVKVTMYTMEQRFMVIPPAVLKKWVTGKGNAKKDLMLLKVYKKFGVEFDDDNLCDAYALAKYGFQFLNPKLKRRI